MNNTNSTTESDFTDLTSFKTTYDWFINLLIYIATLLSFKAIILLYWLRFECQIGKKIAESIVELFIE